MSNVFETIKVGVEEAKEHFLAEFMSRVKRRTPVRTGTLRDGWEGEITADAIQVKNEVDYASFIEYGTSKIEPRAMLRTTAEESEEILALALEKAKI